MLIPLLALSASLVFFGLAFALRGPNGSNNGRWRNVLTAIVVTMGVSMMTLTLFLLLQGTFTSSFGHFPFRLIERVADR